MILVVVLHFGEDDSCFLPLTVPNKYYNYYKKAGEISGYMLAYGQTPELIALKKPENKLHHWSVTSMITKGIKQKRMRKPMAMNKITAQVGKEARNLAAGF